MDLNYIYGPVNSWRFGRSLGIDLLSQEKKVCSFNCVYCQVQDTIEYSIDRKMYVPTEVIVEELKALSDVATDCVTFSGRGEPTLAANLGECIKEVKKIRKEKCVVLTNSSMIYRDDVRADLSQADIVECKLDACSEESFAMINSPERNVNYVSIVDGITKLRQEYKGTLALQIMFLKDNMKEAEGLASVARTIKPDIVHINTPLRPSKGRSLSKEELEPLKKYFSGLKVISVYDERRHERAVALDKEKTMKRRGDI